MRDWQPILGLPLWFWLFIAPSLFALFCLYNRNIARRIITPVWRILDPIYKISGVIAADVTGVGTARRDLAGAGFSTSA